jgi:hypothetical protein
LTVWAAVRRQRIADVLPRFVITVVAGKKDHALHPRRAGHQHVLEIACFIAKISTVVGLCGWYFHAHCKDTVGAFLFQDRKAKDRRHTFLLPPFSSSGINRPRVCPSTYDIHDGQFHRSKRFAFSSREETSESPIDRADAGDSLSRDWNLYDYRMEANYRGEGTALDYP